MLLEAALIILLGVYEPSIAIPSICGRYAIKYCLAEALRNSRAGVLSEVYVVDDKVRPRRGALYCTGHRLGGLALTQEIESLPFHSFKFVFVHVNVVAALFGVVKQWLQAAVEMLVHRERLAAIDAFERLSLGHCSSRMS